MVLSEWQAEVLERLHVLEDQGHFKHNAYTIPGLADLMRAQGILLGHSTLRKFLYELRGLGLLRERAVRLVGNKEECVYVFVGKKALRHFYNDFLSSASSKLLRRCNVIFVD